MTKLTKAQLALRTKWTTALRSGEYRQTHEGFLKDSQGYCCMGVLCDVSDNTGWAYHPFAGVVRFNGCDDYPPEHILKEVGIDEGTTVMWTGSDGSLPPFPKPLRQVLAHMNDNEGADFATIADTIDLDTLMRQDGCL